MGPIGPLFRLDFPWRPLAGNSPVPRRAPHMTGPAPVRPVPGHGGAAIASGGTPPGEHNGGPPQLVVDRRRLAGGAPCRVHAVWTTRAWPADITLDAVWPPPHPLSGSTSTLWR